MLGAPIAVALVALLLHLGQALGDPRLAWYIGPYYQCVVACAMIAVAYAVERRQPPEEDYAFWFYLAGLVMLLVAYVAGLAVHRSVATRAPARRGRARDRVALPSAPHAPRRRWHSRRSATLAIWPSTSFAAS